mgnify:CR=1 FL=1
MKELLNEEWLRQVLEAARDCRVRQLESEFIAWEECQEATKLKEEILARLEPYIQRGGKEILFQYDDAFSLLQGRAQDFFYERGFADCFRMLVRILVHELIAQGKSGQ